ncbi:MAG: hypothetical protein GTN36_05795 [Candidatus Aenigmarchaeota archaeon]|nr:hypothetical protein [Candidatus Aenigmarchaeota archaeon]
MAHYDTHQVVGALELISENSPTRKELIHLVNRGTEYDDLRKVRLKLYDSLEHWGIIKQNPSNSKYELTEGGSAILKKQKVKHGRRKHFFNFISELRENFDGSLSADECKQDTWHVWTQISYFRTMEERMKLDEIAEQLKMSIEVKQDKSGFKREYIFKGEETQTTVISLQDGQSYKTCQPLRLEVNVGQPIEPAERLISLLYEKLKR